MAGYTQTDRMLSVTTPLGKDALLIRALRGREAISELFRFELDLVADRHARVDFDRVLGQKVSVALEQPGSPRHFSGICSRVAALDRDEEFAYYVMEVVPEFWFLTRKSQSRIFQQKAVPDILKAVLEGLQVDYRLQGQYHPRDYCVQYRETDFAFASRLMEEEGIRYFFTHDDKGHKLVLSDQPQQSPPVRGRSEVTYEPRDVGGHEHSGRVFSWTKAQEVRPGKVTLWDQCFELPGQNLEAQGKLPSDVKAGTVGHALALKGNGKLELYDFPGAYAQRFDGVTPDGGDRSGDLGKIFQDNRRTAQIRIEEQAAQAVTIEGTGTCRALASGHTFKLRGHPDADGGYLLTSVTHEATQGEEYRSSGPDGPAYENRFTCIPADLPYRPRRTTPRPTIPGAQTAVVVGPPGEEIFTDKYGRVKVQFPWDREGKKDERSSCWVRVAQFAAGAGWGMISIPRVGQEVVVQFEEGDPDRPLITGCVFNPDQPPPFKLPDQRMISGFRSSSYPGGGGDNEISFDDTKGKERMYIHAQYNQDTVVGNDRTAMVGQDSLDQVANDATQKVGHDLTIEVANKMTEKVGVVSEEQVGVAKQIFAGKNVVIGAGTSITLKCGASLIHMNQAGVIMIQGTMINIVGAINTNITAPLTTISGAAVFTGGALTVSAGGWNKVMGGVTTVDGGPVKINCS